MRVAIHVPDARTIAASEMTAFTRALEAHTGRSFPDYAALHDFCVRDYRTFWGFFAQWSHDVLGLSGDAQPVCVGDEVEHACFFPGLKLNYADSLLNTAIAAAGAPALTACHADGRCVKWTREALRDSVARLAHSLSVLGLAPGDRVVGVMRNDGAAVIAALAVTALGATLSTAAPEMGAEAILDRFVPLAPRLLLAHAAAQPFDTGIALPERIANLAAALPSLRDIVTLDAGALPERVAPTVHALSELIARGDASRFAWPRFAFNHPLFILFSSGTTGRPKCIVHGAGGSLLEHVKEHRLHTGLRPGDRMYFHTSCGWMMWNWQLSALASGVEIVTYDGPIAQVDTLWRLVAGQGVTVFGTSPAYLAMCEEAGLAPGRQFDLTTLSAVLSTGSVLFDRQFRWMREHVKDLPLQSISGGTDILGCFVLGNPNLPVHEGEAQCQSLGLDVQPWQDGRRTEGVGELICASPFPSRPLGFFGDTDGSRFHAAYFAANPGVWTHGDLIEFSAQGGARLHGRSDGVLNVRGINVAPGDIYRVLKDVAGIREAMAVQQRVGAQDDELRVVLLLVLQPAVELDAGLVGKVRRELALRLSAAHVPDIVVAVDELPTTHSGKFSEAAARNAVNGLPVGNAAALRNPRSLEAIRASVAKRADEVRVRNAASRASLEQQLQVLWQDRFGFEPIGPHENFFDLGGNSLLAARLLADVGQLTGRAFPLSTLLVAPTYASLAAWIEKGGAGPTATQPVPMRPGEGRPLFIVHGLNGSVMDCWPLAQALRTPRPIYGLQALGLDGEQAPQHKVEDMAASYVAQVRGVQQQGPYVLVGYSFGGLVALEMARVLFAAGERCEMICLLDTYALQDLPWTAWVRHKLERVRNKARQLPATELLGLMAGKLALAVEGSGWLPSRRVSAGPPNPVEALPPLQRRVHESMDAAMVAYRPQACDGGPILYVRAQERLGDYFDPLPLWRGIARAGLTIAEVPGRHLEIVGPTVKLAAAAIDGGLARF